MNIIWFKQLALLLVSLIWGTTFVLAKQALAYLPTYYYLACRFFLAAFVLFVFSFTILRQSRKKEIILSSLMGLLLFTSYACQSIGLQYTTASKNAFICGLYVVMVPFAAYLFFKEKLTAYAIGSAFLATIGLALLSCSGQTNFLPAYGDCLAFLSAIFAALQIVLVGRYANRIQPIILAFWQILVVALASGMTTLAIEDIPTHIPFSVWTIVIFLALAATTGAFLIQCWAQQDTNHTTTAIIFSLEAVFGAVFAYLVLHEPFTGKMLFGCSLLFMAMILSQQKTKEKELSSL